MWHDESSALTSPLWPYEAQGRGGQNRGWGSSGELLSHVDKLWWKPEPRHYQESKKERDSCAAEEVKSTHLGAYLDMWGEKREESRMAVCLLGRATGWKIVLFPEIENTRRQIWEGAGDRIINLYHLTYEMPVNILKWIYLLAVGCSRPSTTEMCGLDRLSGLTSVCCCWSYLSIQ